MMSTEPSASSEMIVTGEISLVRAAVTGARRKGERIAVVPTMGALHEGHLSLVEAAQEDCGFVVVTIFVNPTQFAPGEDYEKYPRPQEEDLAKCRVAGVNLVFSPTQESIYPGDFSTYVSVEGLSATLEGEHRPTHFRGVTTVVLKLLNIVHPDVACFGLKDFQQQLLIKRMCRDLDLPIQIRSCPIVREEDGLALSSRNRYLSNAERKTALLLSATLFEMKVAIENGEQDLSALLNRMRERLATDAGIDLDYLTIVDGDTLAEVTTLHPNLFGLVAAKVGETRLIDNHQLTGDFAGT